MFTQKKRNGIKSGFRVKIPIINFIEDNISDGNLGVFCINVNTQVGIKGI